MNDMDFFSQKINNFCLQKIFEYIFVVEIFTYKMKCLNTNQQTVVDRNGV